MGVVPMTVAAAVVGREVLLAVLHHARHEVVVVLAGVEQAGDGRGGDGGPTAAAFGAVLDAAFGQRAILNVLHGFVDDFLRHGDAGVAAAAEALHLRDRGGAFVEAAAVFRADVAPAAGLRLSLAGELRRRG